jgi:hypothetical protein
MVGVLADLEWALLCDSDPPFSLFLPPESLPTTQSSLQVERAIRAKVNFHGDVIPSKQH